MAINLKGNDESTFAQNIKSAKQVEVLNGIRFGDGTVQTTAATGGGGGDSSGSGADAWGQIAADGTIEGSLNVASATKVGLGVYDVVFTTAMPNADYSVQVSARPNGSSNVIAQWSNLEADTFRVILLDPVNDVNIDSSFTFSVFSTNTITPQAGVGADAWGSVAADGTLQSGFNCTVENTEAGKYRVSFVTPMPNTFYSVTTGGASANTKVRDRATDGFNIENTDSDNNLTDSNFGFSVFASSTITPTFTWTRSGTVVRTANAGDDVAVGDLSTGSLSSGSGVGLMNWGGVIATSEAGNQLFIGYTKGTTTSVVNIGSDGVITAAGSFSTGNVTSSALSGTGARMRNTGDISIRKDGGVDSVFEVFRDGDGSSNRTYQLNNEGSITAAGNLSISGTTTVSSGGIKYGADAAQFMALFYQAVTGGGLYQVAAGSGTKRTICLADSTNSINFNWGAPNLHASIDHGSEYFVIGTASDYRIKENVSAVSNGVELVKQLNPVTYTIKETKFKTTEFEKSDTMHGFIAHELGEVIPEAAVGTKDDPETLQSVNTYPIVSVLTKALQESIARIEALEAKVAALQS